MKKKTRLLFVSTAIICFYILILYDFKSLDIYDDHFFDVEYGLIYNLGRVFFIVYLCATICVPGYAALAAIGGRTTLARLPPLARLTGSFFCGAACWHSLLLVLGFLNLYVYPVAVALTVPAAALAAPLLRGTFSELCRDARVQLQLALPAVAWITRCLAILTLAAAVLLLVVKGLFPAGGHDYFNHYHGYYEAVLRNHGLWPNDVWYQFYYSKGMGLFFLSILLTDPLAPSLVTYCFAIGAALALYLLIDRMAPGASFWPWIAVIAYFVFYTYTPGIDDYRNNGGWADFQKPHEINAAFIIGFLWLCVGTQGSVGRERLIWFFAAASCILIVSFVELVSVLILGLFTTILIVGALVRRRWGEAKAFFALSLVGGCGLFAVLSLNYALTGLPSDQFALQTWPWANVQTLYKWGSLPWLVIEMQGLATMRAQGIHWESWRFVDLYQDFLRLDLVRPLLIMTPIFLVLLGSAAIYRMVRTQCGRHAAPLKLLVVFIVVLAVAAAAAGADQKISFYRYSSFCLPVVLGLVGCGWLYICASIRIGWLNGAVRYLLPLVLLVAALSQFWIKQKQFLQQVIPNALAFADGSISIRRAYADQQGWPGRHPWGGIFPGTIGAWKTAGPGTRIWSMHLGAYCMLPHCRSETLYSFTLSPHFLDILADSAEETRDALRSDGLNYFFFTTEMDIDDVLPLIKPFTPDQIADYLGIKWTDGKSYLLTWLGPGVAPLTPEWVVQYKKMVDTAPYQPTGFPLKLMSNLREQMNAHPHWGRELELPGILPN